MLTLTSPVDTPYDRLPAGGKLAALVVVSSLVFWIDNPWVLTAALAMVMGLYLVAGPPLLAFGLRLLWPLWPFALMIAGWHLWRGTPVLGVVVLVRMAIAVMLANLVTMTTRLDDMITVITRLAAPLGALGLPPRRLALALALAIRFIPDLMQSADRLSLAWRARATGRARHRLIAPLTLAAIDTADQVAEALRARGGAG
jgi:biotin transport system permease protein